MLLDIQNLEVSLETVFGPHVFILCTSDCFVYFFAYN